MLHIHAPFSGWATITQTPYGTDSHNSSDYWGAAFDFDLDANPSGSGDTALQDRQVLAVSSGVVVGSHDGSTETSGPGNFVTVLFNPGTSEQFYASYWHLKGGTVSVAIGDEVQAGTVLGEQGNTGGSKGAHLHFQWSKEIYVHHLGAMPNAVNDYDGLIVSLSGDSSLGAYTQVQSDISAISGERPNNARYIVGDTYLGGENLVGNALDNWFQGGPGLDSYDGRSGFDTVDFTDRPSIGWVIDLDPVAGYAVASTGGTEQLRSIEAVALGNKDDLVYLPEVETFVQGGSGRDTVSFDDALEDIWFWKDVDGYSAAMAGTTNAPIHVFKDVEVIRSVFSDENIDLERLAQNTLGVGASSSSTKYILPDIDVGAAYIDGGGGYDVVSVSGSSSDWSATAHTTAQYRLSKNTGSSSKAEATSASADNLLDTIDLDNVEAVEFDDGTFTIDELLGSGDPNKATLSISLKSGDGSRDEGDIGHTPQISYLLTLDKALSSDLDVNWEVSGYGPNPANGTDFEKTSGVREISAGKTEVTLGVDFLGDVNPEFDEGFRVRIWLTGNDADKAQITQPYGYGTILNDDGDAYGNDDAGNSFSTAKLLGNDPNEIDGIIETSNDVDYYTAYLFAGLDYSFTFGGISGDSRNRFENGTFKFFDSTQTEISYTDLDTSEGFATFHYTPTEDGVFYFEVDSPDNSDVGEYQILYYVRSPSLVDRLPNGLSGATSTLDAENTVRWFGASGFSTESPTISLRTDQDLSNFDLALFGLNGQRINGTWEEKAPGVYNFDFQGIGGEDFLFRIEALNADAYGEFTVENYYQSWHLPGLQTEFSGDGAANLIDANGLDNAINGLGGNDTLRGNRGEDTIKGGGGADTLFGGDDDDILEGGLGADELNGGAGIDIARYIDSAAAVEIDLFKNTSKGGSAQGDTFFLVENLSGSNFADILIGDNSANVLSGFGSNDVMRGGENNDTLFGGLGTDQLFGDAGDDVLNGGDGLDLLYGNQGRDLLNGGALRDILNGGFGNDTLKGGTGDDQLIGHNDHDRLEGQGGQDSLHGGNGNDKVFGGAGKDTLQGGRGNDTLLGGTQNDTVKGGEGTDVLYGSKGNDVLFGEAHNDCLYGNIGDDKLFGGIGHDKLYGGSGTDTLTGGNGNDTLFGGSDPSVLDVFEFAANAGTDRIEDFELGIDKIDFNISGLTYGALAITGQSGGSLIDYGSGTVFLAGVPKLLLTESDFLF